MISNPLLSQAKAVSIASYLEEQGYLPERQLGPELLYKSPLRVENTPSFYVHLTRNVFKDFGADDHRGDVIKLCQLLEGCSFADAVTRLLSGSYKAPCFSFSGSLVKEEKQSSMHLTAVKPVTHAALVAYTQSRGIPLTVAQTYLKQVHYERSGKSYFALGFANDAGGYALRNGAGFKGQTMPAGISTIPGQDPSSVCLFEGFFDFLSALVYFQKKTPRFTCIVLNSTAQLSKAIPALKAYRSVRCFLDRDAAGRKAITQLEEKGLTVEDQSNLYDGYNDFNEFLTLNPQ